jgi:uncharacterized protein with ATP-grasp and redox domains
MDLALATELSETRLRAAVTESLNEPLNGDIEEFERAVAQATRILYLTDNAGEIVFDRLLIEQLPRERVTVAVRGAPVINDATLADAEVAGIPNLVPVIDNGSDAPGTLLEDCSQSFRRHFEEADLIISKGQGNFETLRESCRPIFFLLRAKCDAVAQDLGCPLGQMILRSPRTARTPAVEGVGRERGTE